MVDSPAPAPPIFETSQRHFGAERVEEMFSLAISVIAFVFGLQTIAFAIGTEPLFVDGDRTWLVVVVMLSLAVVIGTGAVPRLQRVSNIGFALIYLAAMLLWPVVSGGADAALPTEPWLWYLNSVACACAAQALSTALAVVYAVVAPITYGIVRTIGPDGVFLNVDIGIFDASYALMMGLIVVSLGVVFRSAASRVDEARASALARYNEAARGHANQAERVEVDAILHDTVLAALQAAERAASPEQARVAVDMARDAVGRLASVDGAARTSGPVMSTERLLESLSRFAESLDRHFRVTRTGEHDRELPWAVGESLYLAAVQAMANSVQHADGEDRREVDREVILRLDEPGVIDLNIVDDGVGFERDAVDPSRLGLRVSIVERVTSVGGTADILTKPAEGTRIRIVWPSQAVRPL
ncbi:hypothetical protein GCM10027416_06450 [Okibacterium endophyticum]